MCERKESFNNSSSEDKSDLWKIQMILYLANHSEINREKQDFLLVAIDFLKPEIYSDSKDEMVRNALQELTAQAIKLFTKGYGI